MAQYFNLTLDQLAPQNGLITVAPFYKDNLETFSMSADEAYFLKVITNTSATAQMSDFDDTAWEVYNTSHAAHATDFETEGTNYIHAIFMDEVGNVGPIVTVSTIYDTSAPTISTVAVTSTKSGDPEGHTTQSEVKVRVSVTDTYAGVDYVTLSGDITESGAAAKFTFTDEDRAAGYKDCTVHLTPITSGKEVSGEMKTISAVATDRSGNDSDSVSGEIEFDTAGGDITATLYKTGLKEVLPTYVKELGFAVRVNTCPNDMVAYEIKDGAVSKKTGTISEGTTTFDVDNLTLENVDGLHTITIILTDDAGNKSEIEKTVNVDRVAPEVTTSFSPALVSDKAGYNVVTFTINGTDGHFDNNVNYTIEVKTGEDTYVTVASGTVASTDNNSKVSTTKDVATSDITNKKALPGDGYGNDYVFRVGMTDAAGMTGYSADTSALEIDEIGPVQTVGNAPQFSKDATITVTGWTAAEVGYSTVAQQYIWVSGNAEETVVPSGAREAAYNNGSISVTAADGLAEGAMYIHVAAVDALDNVGAVVNSSKIIYDLTKPTVDITVPTTTQESRSQSLTLSYNDGDDSKERSEVKLVRVWGDIEEHSTKATALIVNAPGTLASVTLTQNTSSGTEVKNIYVEAEDNAGNLSGTVQKTITLETVAPQGTLKIYNEGHSEEITGKRRNVPEFEACINFSDDEANIEAYKIWGDFQGSAASEAAAQWVEFSAEDQDFFVQNLKCTTDAQGEKRVYIAVRDQNGNIGHADNAFIYDTTAATITVDDVDYNKISLVHQARKDTTTGSEIANTFDDMMTFTFTSDEDLFEYKVCVNNGETEQAAIEAAVAIGTTGGSVNMHGGTGAAKVVEANATVACTIMGADFAAHPVVVEHGDGAYEVIVFGKDEAGTWSAGHAITYPTPSKAGEATYKGQPLTIITNKDVPDNIKEDAPANSAVVSYGTNADISEASDDNPITLTADVSELDLGADDTVDVYHYE